MSVVSLELRYGMWFCLPAKAAMTSPSAARLLLMCCASFSRAPVASDRSTRSDPARSTRLKVPTDFEPVTLFTPRTYGASADNNKD
eukprot:9499134-Pyramimonas_sp.AAC.2